MKPRYTQMTMKQLREWGYTAQVVERWCNYSRRRIDLFGVVDIVAFHPDAGIIFVQSTSGSCHAARRTKIEQSDEAKGLIDAGGVLELWSWAKRGDRGKAKRWTLRRETFKRLDPGGYRIDSEAFGRDGLPEVSPCCSRPAKARASDAATVPADGAGTPSLRRRA